MTHPNVSLNLITWLGYVDPAATRGFCDERGVRLTATYVDDDDEAISIAAGRLGTADLISVDSRMIRVLVEDNLIQPIDLSALSNAVDYIERFPEIVRYLGSGTTWGAPYIWGTSPLVYNATAISAPPSSWMEVGSPEYRGKVAIVDCYLNQIVTWSRALGYPDPTRITKRELAELVDLVLRIKSDTDARILTWDEIPEALVRGDVWISTGGWEAIVEFAARQGGDVRYTHPAEGVDVWMDCWCILRESPNAGVAHAWIDWMIGVEAQRAVSESLVCGAVNSRAIPLIRADVRSLFRYDDIGGVFASRADFDLPPLAAEGDVATLDDWKDAWAEVVAQR
jgi:putative spermidine/putrescine transport system substrate-binding protein/spermidine/putrescine transport system substrate-binding protein